MVEELCYARKGDSVNQAGGRRRERNFLLRGAQGVRRRCMRHRMHHFQLRAPSKQCG